MHFYKASTSPFLKGTSSYFMHLPWQKVFIVHLYTDNITFYIFSKFNMFYKEVYVWQVSEPPGNLKAVVMVHIHLIPSPWLKHSAS